MSAATMTRLIRGRLLGNRWRYHGFQSFHASPAAADAEAATDAQAATDAEAALYRQFERWMFIHTKVYGSDLEKRLRFRQFKERVQRILRCHEKGIGPPLRLSKLILRGDGPDIFDDAERAYPDE